MTSSVRSFEKLFEPNRLPTMGNLCNTGIPADASVLVSWMMPPIAIVSPSCTVTCVLTAFWENEGDWIAELEEGCCGSLTCWLMIIVTMPLGFTRARMLRVTPVLTLEMVLVNSELPPTCTPAPRPCELSVGTVLPTLIEA